jgi:hypothetical protein
MRNGDALGAVIAPRLERRVRGSAPHKKISPSPSPPPPAAPLPLLPSASCQCCQPSLVAKLRSRPRLRSFFSAAVTVVAVGHSSLCIAAATPRGKNTTMPWPTRTDTHAARSCGVVLSYASRLPPGCFTAPVLSGAIYKINAPKTGHRPCSLS